MSVGEYFVITLGFASYEVVRACDLDVNSGFSYDGPLTFTRAKLEALSRARNDKGECDGEIRRIRALKKEHCSRDE